MNKEEIEEVKLFFSKQHIEYLKNEDGTSTEISVKTIKKTKDYIDQLENKVQELIKGQASLMQSRKKWKARYYKERRKRKEVIDFLKARIKMYEICFKANGIPKGYGKIIEQEILDMLGGENERNKV